MKSLLLTFFVLAAVTGTFCQSTEKRRDNLNQILSDERDDKTIADALYELSTFEESLSESRVNYIRRGLLLSRRSANPALMAKGYRMLASALIVKSALKSDSCLFYLSKADSISMHHHLEVEEAEALVMRAHVLIEIGEYLKAANVATRSATLAEAIGDKHLMARSYINLSRLFANLEMDSSSLDYSRRALDELDSIADRKLTAKPLLLIGNYFLNQGKFNEALRHYEKSRRIFDEFRLYKDEAVVMSNIAAVYFHMGDIPRQMAYNRELMLFCRKHRLPQEANAHTTFALYFQGLKRYDSAYAHFAQAREIWIAHGFSNSRNVIDDLTSMGKCLFKMGRTKEAIAMLEEAYEAIQKTGDYASIRVELLSLLEVYDATGKIDRAYQLQKELIKYTDSLQSREKFKELGRIEFKYDLEKAQREKNALTLQREAAEARIKQKNFEQLALVLVLLIVVSITVLIIRLYRQKARTNHELEIKNKTINLQREELQTTLENNIKIQEQLISAEKMASLGHLTAGIAHELNNPLNFISGGFGAIKDIYGDLVVALKSKGSVSDENVAELEDQIRSLMVSVEKGIERSTTIIKSLRVFSNPTTTISESLFSLKECMNDALVILQSKIKSTNVEVILDIDKSHKALGSEPMINRVFVNMIDNAVAALDGIDRERRIIITSKLAGDFVNITIRDSGAGISKENMRNVMNPFFTTKEVGKGTGLGLSISYMIVERHGGKLSFTSEEGVGTEFLISLRKR